MPFMDAPPGSLVSGTASMAYGSVIRSLRNITLKKTDSEPKWRKKGNQLLTGYKPSW
jgi:hydrogenase small subunit